LANRPVDVTLVDRRNHHLFQPLLYQVATGMLSSGQISPPLRHIVRRAKNIKVEQAEVHQFDLEKRVVKAKVLATRDIEIPYDSLIVATGSNQSYFGHDEFSRWAPGMKTIDDARELRRRIFGAFEVAEQVNDPVEKQRWLTMVVVGAGPTGVELAGQIRELAVRCLRGEFRTFAPASVRVVLVDAGAKPLASFGDRLAADAARMLEEAGVDLELGAQVVNVGFDGVEVRDHEGGTRHIDAHTVLWAAGVQASPLAGELAHATDAKLDRSGRIAVLSDLTLPGHPEVFAVGDMTTLQNLPGVAEVALQGGLHAANSILRRQRGLDVLPFKYRDVGNVATIGRFKAVSSIRKLHLHGFPAWLVWFFVHLAFLTGFGDRFSTMLRWLRSMVGRGRAERQFSTAHTGGDLSLPETVREIMQPVPYPNAAKAFSDD
jgi:NADH dehydrogenase